MACSSLPPASEVVGRLCFYRRVWFCSQWGVCSREGCLLPRGVSALGGWGSAPRGICSGGSDGDPPIFFCIFLHFFGIFLYFFAFFKFSFAFLPFFHTMVNEQVVCILLECILVLVIFTTFNRKGLPWGGGFGVRKVCTGDRHLQMVRNLEYWMLDSRR